MDDQLPPPMPDPWTCLQSQPHKRPWTHTGLLAQEFLRDRRAERRWRVFFRLIWLGVAVFLVYGIWAQGKHVSTTAAPHTALVEVRGEIAADTEASAELLLSACAMPSKTSMPRPWCFASTRPAAAPCRRASSTTRSRG